MARHPAGGTRALPLQSQLYLRQQDLAKRAAERRPLFRTKLERAAEQLHWLKIWARARFASLEAVVDGAYAKRPLLRAARRAGSVRVGRLACNAALGCLPKPKPQGQRGPQPTYGKQRIDLAKRAGHRAGWQQVG